MQKFTIVEIKRALYSVTVALLFSFFAFGQTKEIPSGSVIIDMGISPQTIDNGVKPYGLVYSLIKNYNVTVIWSIEPTKISGGTDFTVDGKTFRGGPFIIEQGSLTQAVLDEISDWEDEGVVTYTTLTDKIIPVYQEINYYGNWVLDPQNGVKITKKYLDAAGIPNTDFREAEADDLTSCDDVYLLPHADVTWDKHGNLINWNSPIADGGSAGWIWTGCKAVSGLENLVDPNDSSVRANFLANDPTVPPTQAQEDFGYSLIYDGAHEDASNDFDNYVQGFPADPFMQFLGKPGKIFDEGAERVYVLFPTGSWRSSTTVAIYDPNQPDVINGIGGLDIDGPAALLAYGRAFGDDDRGMVMYEAGHEFKDKNDDPDDNGGENGQVAAIRAFLNFSLLAPNSKVPTIVDDTGTVPSTISSGEPIQFDLSGSTGSGTLSFEWTTSCSFGTFDNPTSSMPIFNPGIVSDVECCVIQVEITDECGRRSFNTYPVCIQPPAPRIEITKAGTLNDENQDNCSDAGETITYDFVVRNLSSVEIENIVVNDPLLGGDIPGPISGDTDNDGKLDINEMWSYSANYIITQDDIDLGQVENQATVTGVGNGQITSDLSDDISVNAPNPLRPKNMYGTTRTPIYTSINPGSWTNPNTWSGGNVPPINLNNTDVVNINTRVELTSGGY
ncbi:DUF7507 domain-containing protein [Aureitalea marina]|nr:hypothetical protein [Aureitalea marina]